MDIIDKAQAYQQQMIDAALSQRRPAGIGRQHCARNDCGEKISDTRRELGAQLCIDCATEHEQRQRIGGAR